MADQKPNIEIPRISKERFSKLEYLVLKESQKPQEYGFPTLIAIRDNPSCLEGRVLGRFKIVGQLKLEKHDGLNQDGLNQDGLNQDGLNQDELKPLSGAFKIPYVCYDTEHNEYLILKVLAPKYGVSPKAKSIYPDGIPMTEVPAFHALLDRHDSLEKFRKYIHNKFTQKLDPTCHLSPMDFQEDKGIYFLKEEIAYSDLECFSRGIRFFFYHGNCSIKEVPIEPHLDDHLPQDEKWKIKEKAARDLAEAVRHCHSHKIAHGDVKAQNVMVFNKDKEIFFKLGDFDTLFDWEDQANFTEHHINGISSTSPDRLAKLDPDQTHVFPKGYDSDRFALGALFFQLFTGRSIFQLADSDPEILTTFSRKQEKLRFIQELSDKIKTDHKLREKIKSSMRDSSVPNHYQKIVIKCFELGYHNIDKIIDDIAMIGNEKIKKSPDFISDLKFSRKLGFVFGALAVGGLLIASSWYQSNKFSDLLGYASRLATSVKNLEPNPLVTMQTVPGLNRPGYMSLMRPQGQEYLVAVVGIAPKKDSTLYDKDGRKYNPSTSVEQLQKYLRKKDYEFLKETGFFGNKDLSDLVGRTLINEDVLLIKKIASAKGDSFSSAYNTDNETQTLQLILAPMLGKWEKLLNKKEKKECAEHAGRRWNDRPDLTFPGMGVLRGY